MHFCTISDVHAKTSFQMWGVLDLIGEIGGTFIWHLVCGTLQRHVCQDLVTDVRGSGASCHGRMPPPPALGAAAEKVTKVRGWQEKVRRWQEEVRGQPEPPWAWWKWEFASIVTSSQAMWSVVNKKVFFLHPGEHLVLVWEVVVVENLVKLQKPGAVGGGGWGGGHPGVAKGGQQERRKVWGGGGGGVQPMPGGGEGQGGEGLAGHTHWVPPAGPGETITKNLSKNLWKSLKIFPKNEWKSIKIEKLTTVVSQW